MRKFFSVFVSILAVVAFGFASANAVERYKFGSGPAGGGWNPAIGAGVQLLNKSLSGKGLKYAHVPSQGSVANIRRVAKGSFHTTWGHVVQVVQQWNGTGKFKKDGVRRDFRIIANVRAQSQIIAVLADSPIKSFSDMAGKRVNLLSRGTGSNVNCMNMFKGAGIFNKIEKRFLGFRDSGRALGDRQIDVYCSAGAPFTIPALTQLSVRKPVRYVGLSESEQKKVVSTFPFYTPVTIPPLSEVKGQTSHARSIAYDVFWVAHKSMSDKGIYEMLKVIADPGNLKKLTKAARYWAKLSGKFDNLKVHKVHVHPAAARYWRSRGTNVPGSVVKGY